MSFDVRALLGFLRAWVFEVPPTFRRLLILAAFCLVFPLLELFLRAGFLLDDLFYRGWRRQPVRAPVFIVGNFRSGTTFLHRLMARDTHNFTTMRMWETLFAPSVVSRKLVSTAATVQSFAGGLLTRWLSRVERDWEMKNPAHKIGLNEAEEDDYLLLHIFSTLTVGLSSGLMNLARPYLHFDEALPASDRHRIMKFYRQCLQRHLYARSTGKERYLAKNPALIPKLETVEEFFPDAWVVVLLRDPAETLASTAAMMRVTWNAVGAGEIDSVRREFLIEMTATWRKKLTDRAGRERTIFVEYPDLVKDPEATVRRIYKTMGMDLPFEFESVLLAEAARARTYTPPRRHSLDDAGISATELQEALSNAS